MPHSQKYLGCVDLTLPHPPNPPIPRSFVSLGFVRLVLIDRSELWKGRPVKSLTQGLTKSGGRNNTGRITSRRIGGGAKRLYRIVDFKRNKLDMSAVVARIEYDPNRTAFIALILTR